MQGITGINGKWAVDVDAVRIGDDEGSAQARHRDLAIDQAGRIAGKLVIDEPGILARVVRD